MSALLDITQLDYFIKEIALFNKAQTPFREKAKFNIFTIIRNGHEEVGLHSKFLFELLSPNGSHKKKDLFLKLFITQLGIDFKLENVEVYCEKNNIDLLVQNNSQAIIIENKIYAGDQPEQLSRYFNSVSSSKIKDIHIVYLSLDGKDPSSQSIENLPDEIIDDRLYTKSYKKFINPWLSLCVKECATQPIIRETIVQYKQLLNHLTMSNEVKEREELLNFLGKGDNMKQAQYIADNWIHMKWHTEWDFWNELSSQKPEKLKNYIPIDKFLYSDEFLNGVIHSRRNKDFEYGITFKLFEYKKEEVCFMIERGDDGLDYGLLINYIDNDKKKYLIHNTDIKDYITIEINDGDFGDEDSPWIHWKYPKHNINFTAFDNDTTLALANPEKRALIVKDLWEEITEYIDTVLQWPGIPKQ